MTTRPFQRPPAAAAITLALALVGPLGSGGCKEPAKPTAATKPAGGAGRSTPVAPTDAAAPVATSLPSMPDLAGLPTSMPANLATQPAGGAGMPPNGLPPLPKITPGTLPTLPAIPMSSTRPAMTRPAFPTTVEFNK